MSTAESKSIVLDVQYTPVDARCLSQSFMRSRRGSTFFWMGAFFAWLLIVYELPDQLSQRTGMSSGTALLITVAVALVTFVPGWRLLARFGRGEAYSPEGSFLRPQRFVIGDDGISIATDRFSASWKWDAFLRWTETPEHFFLFTDNRIALIIPKRSIHSPNDAQNLSKIIAGKIREHSDATTLEPAA